MEHKYCTQSGRLSHLPTLRGIRLTVGVGSALTRRCAPAAPLRRILGARPPDPRALTRR